MKSVVWSMLIGFGLAAATVPCMAEKLVVYGDEDYAPVIYLQHGKPAGILPAIFARISKDTGDTYELVLVPWKRALLESERGKGGITGISFNEARGAVYDFSRPAYHDDIHLVVLKGKEFPFQDIKDLKGKTAGGQSGASYGSDVDAAIAAGALSVDRDSGQANRLKKLMLGRIDVAIIGNGLAGFEQLIASEPELKAHRDKFVVLERPLVRDPLYLAFAKSMAMKPALDRFNKALMAFQKTSEYSRLVGSRQ